MDIKKLMTLHPEIAKMADYEEIWWTNPDSGTPRTLDFNMDDILEAEARLARFAPYIQAAFPETEVTGGIIESPLKEIPEMKKILEEKTYQYYFQRIDGMN